MKPRIETSQISTKIASRSKPHDFTDVWLTSGQASEILVYLHEQNTHTDSKPTDYDNN